MRRAAGRLSIPAALTAASVALIGGLAPAGAAGRTPDVATVDAGVYLVVLRTTPLASYAGDTAGFARTEPRAGHRFRAHSPAADAYRSHLLEGQADVLARLGDPVVLYRYTTALDGLAVELSSEQVKAASALPEVAFVERDARARLTGIPGPNRAIGSSTPSTTAAAQLRAAEIGRGVVIGVIDSGIAPENPSFAGIPVDRDAIRSTYPGFTGRCARHGADWTADGCNSKILAARAFISGFGRDQIAVSDDASPRDTSGHGSRTAAIAAGNADIDVTIGSQEFGAISGHAPGAGLAIYKACWRAPDPSDDGCSTADSVAAIDRAVSDGVDVLSYSIGDSPAAAPGLSAVETAFLNASEAGVFVATSAGDSGPSPSTVAHDSPWVTTVGATSTEHYIGRLALGDGERFRGAMVSDRAVRDRRLVYAADAAARGASAEDAALCYPGSLDASRVDGAIVLCDRGSIARVDKSATVKLAGGVAMVLGNVRPGSTDADLHAVPTVHVGADDAARIKAYLATARHATATIRPIGASVAAPTLAPFSSRGPATTLDGAILKPDLTAPGVNVLAATSPDATGGSMWDLGSGTSMATPAVAGAAAAIRAAHRDWSTAMIGSALQTTATALDPAGSPLARGAGEVDEARALDPGLVYDVDDDGWSAYQRAVARGRASGAARLNLPSITLPELIGETAITRTVTSVGDTTETYQSSVSGMRGVNVSIDPPTLTLAPGASASYTVMFSARSGAQYEQFATGALSWRGSAGHRVVSPLAVRPVFVRAPAEVRSGSSDHTAPVGVRAGVTGTVHAAVVGPVAAMPELLTVDAGAFDSAAPDAGQAVVRTFSVGPRTAAVRFEALAADDVDLYVYDAGRLVASATSPDRRETVELRNPQAGTYDVYLVAGDADADSAVSVSFTGWVLPRSARSTDARVPHRYDVTGGRRFTVDVPVVGLSSHLRWFGQLSFEDSDAVTDLLIN